MVLRLGYPDRIVEVSRNTVYVFKGRLFSAPLDEVVRYYTTGDALLPPALREVAESVAAALLRAGGFDAETSENTPTAVRMNG